MSHIRKNIQLAKTYEDDNMVIDEALAKQELIARERIRIAIIKMKVLELANTPEWINSKFAGEATEGRLVGKYIPISVNTQNLPERRPNDFPQN